MSLTTELMTKAGYELTSIGAEIFPCTLTRDREPIGFLKEDGTVSLLREFEAAREELEAIAAYGQEYGMLENIPEGQLMTSFRDVSMTVQYDFGLRQPVYRIYRETDNGKELLSVTGDRENSVTQFLSFSGLSQSPQRESVSEISTRSQELSSQKPVVQKYSIRNEDGKEVGYISSKGKAVLYGQQPAPAVKPSFFDKLRQKISEIGLAVRVQFQRNGAHYAIHNQTSDIAYISPEQQITYTPSATDEQRKKIDALVAEILAEREQGKKTTPEQAVPVQEPAQDITWIPSMDEEVPEPEENLLLKQRNESILKEFDAKMEQIALMEGFNPEQSEKDREAVRNTYGTLDRAELEAMLQKTPLEKEGYLPLTERLKDFGDRVREYQPEKEEIEHA